MATRDIALGPETLVFAGYGHEVVFTEDMVAYRLAGDTLLTELVPRSEYSRQDVVDQQDVDPEFDFDAHQHVELELEDRQRTFRVTLSIRNGTLNLWVMQFRHGGWIPLGRVGIPWMRRRIISSAPSVVTVAINPR